jgi:hypothetical protein
MRREGTAEVATAVTASTLTSVAVFFLMVFVSGIAGQLFRDQAPPSRRLLISLMVALPWAHADRVVSAPRRQGSRTCRRCGDEPAKQRPRRATPARLISNFNVGSIVRPRESVANSASRVPAFIRWIAAPFRCVAMLSWLLRLAITFSCERCESCLAFSAKCSPVSPFVWITQKSYNVLDRHYPGFSIGRWSAAPHC